MKFGNYNLTAATETETHNRLFYSRLKKVKNTSSYIAGKFNSQINTFRKINSNIGKRKTTQPTGSPLSYRASLFDDRKHDSQKCRELREKLEKYRADDSVYESCSSQKYFPDDFHRPSSSLFDDRKSPNEQCVFDKVKFSKINNAISGKRQHKMQKNVYFTISANKRANTSNLYETLEYGSWNINSSRKSSNHSLRKVAEDEPKIKMDLSTLLKPSPPYDEKAELEILKNYFEQMTYSEICKDTDFKNYLKKKNYQDAIDYIYSGTSLMGSSLRGDKSSIYGAATDVLRRYYDLDLDIVKDSNDCDSIKNEKQCVRPQSIDTRKYYNKENSQFFCKSNREFDDYYKRNTNIFYEATKTVADDFFENDLNDLYQIHERANRMFQEINRNDDESLIDELYGHKSQPFVYCTMPTRKISKDSITNPDPDSNDKDDASEITKYQTFPKKRPRKTYEELLRFCENSLACYATLDIKMEKWQKLSKKEYSEKTYTKIIKAFVRLRGFENVDSYVQYHYGRILDKSFDSHLKERLKQTIGSQDEQLVISKPILRTTTQLSVAANSRLDSMPPPYTSGSYDNDSNNYFYKRHQATQTKTHDDCFKHFDNVKVDCSKQKSSSVDGNEPSKRTLFKFVEDMYENGIDFDGLIVGGLHSRSCENLKSETRASKQINERTCNNYSQCKNFGRKLNEMGKRSVDNIYESIRGEAIHKHHSHKCIEAHERKKNVIS